MSDTDTLNKIRAILAESDGPAPPPVPFTPVPQPGGANADHLKAEKAAYYAAFSGDPVMLSPGNFGPNPFLEPMLATGPLAGKLPSVLKRITDFYVVLRGAGFTPNDYLGEGHAYDVGWQEPVDVYEMFGRFKKNWGPGSGRYALALQLVPADWRTNPGFVRAWGEFGFPN